MLALERVEFHFGAFYFPPHVRFFDELTAELICGVKERVHQGIITFGQLMDTGVKRMICVVWKGWSFHCSLQNNTHHHHSSISRTHVIRSENVFISQKCSYLFTKSCMPCLTVPCGRGVYRAVFFGARCDGLTCPPMKWDICSGIFEEPQWLSCSQSQFPFKKKIKIVPSSSVHRASQSTRTAKCITEIDKLNSKCSLLFS